LVDETAQKHLEREQERLESKIETKLRRELTREANAAAKRKAEEAVEAAEKKIRDEVGREESKQRDVLQRRIDKLVKQNRELERSLDGVNAPDRGDMHEADIFERLTNAFPEDEITREGKGGDIVHVVRYSSDHEFVEAGVILYECKDTKTWKNSFVDQIKADGRRRRTPYLVLVSRALPKDVKDACVQDEVIVADSTHAPILARIVRRMVIETSRAGLAGRNRAGKTARLYEYLLGDEFREEFAAVVEAGSELSAMLEKERQGHEREWAKRKRAYDELAHNSVAIDEAIRAIIESDAPTAEAARKAKAKPWRQRDQAHAARV